MPNQYKVTAESMRRIMVSWVERGSKNEGH